MKSRCCFFYLSLAFSITLSQAQDQAGFTQFYLNPYLVNPSFAGIDGQTAFSVIYRRQWMDIEGGPSIANVSLQTPINARASFGMSITNDKQGLLNNSGLLFTLGYNVSLAEHSFIRFGLSAGGSWNTIDLEKFESSTDPALANILNRQASITGNAGLSFHYKFFHLGAALPSIFSPSYISENNFNITEVKPFESVIIHTSNRFYFNHDKNIFEPYALYRLNKGLPSQFEFAGILHLNHVIWVGGSYKQDFGISALGGIKLQNKLAIGGSYSLKNSGTNELNSPSFEVNLTLLLGKRRKNAPVYSFVNTIKEKKKKPRPSAAELAKRKQEEEHKKQMELLAKQQAEEAKKKQDSVEKAKNEKAIARETPPDTLNKADLELQQHAAEELAAQRQHHYEDSVKQAQQAAQPILNEHHEYIKRGLHEKELAPGEYVIGGVFKSESNAQHFADGLRKLNFKADYGHLSEKDLWYVYLVKSNDINHARAERDRFRKMQLLKDAWLLTVQ